MPLYMTIYLRNSNNKYWIRCLSQTIEGAKEEALLAFKAAEVGMVAIGCSEHDCRNDVTTLTERDMEVNKRWIERGRKDGQQRGEGVQEI